MSRVTPPPSMAQSASYYDHRASHPSIQSQYHYPPIPNLQRPQAVHHIHTRSSPTQSSMTDRQNPKTSVSSATSGSTADSGLNKYPAQQPFRYGSQAERGLINDGSVYQSQSGRHPRTPPNASHYTPTEMVEDNSAVFRYIQHRDLNGYEEEEENDHAVRILIWLSLLGPVHSIFSAIFSIFTLFFLVISSPIRICRSQASFSISFIRIVAPVFRNHLQMIYAPSVGKAHTFEFSPTGLILVHVASPFLSVGVAIASWVAGVFWLFAITMGNPDGTEKRDDGKAAVLMVRNWWEKYLLNALR